MGCCGSSLSEDQRIAIADSARLDRMLSANQNEDNKIIKLLLLGTGESGKSTIFKQMQLIYQPEGFTDFEKSTFRHVIRRNVVEAMQTLLIGCLKFGSTMLPDSADAARFMIDLDPLAADFWSEEIVAHVKQLWNNEPAIRACYEMRARLQLIDSAQYLFVNIDRIGKPNYLPSDDDIVRARLRTSGIVEKMFRINGVDFKLIDVGGQRNERRKWIHSFENVTAVIFVAAISEYDQVLYEDEKENRLTETFRVFDQICNNEYFLNTAMILFLNKTDLFQEKIKRVPLSNHFADYTGDNSFESASSYLQERFRSLNKQDKMIFPHFTCATDKQNVQRVFEDCKMVILKNNLEKLGLG